MNALEKKEYFHNYYMTHKDAKLEKQGTKILCECGITYAIGHKSHHTQSFRHQRNLNETAQLPKQPKPEKCICICGGKFNLERKLHHYKSKKHIEHQTKIKLEINNYLLKNTDTTDFVDFIIHKITDCYDTPICSDSETN